MSLYEAKKKARRILAGDYLVRSGRRRITAEEWKRRGGLRNNNLYRRQAVNGRWLYYSSQDDAS